MKQPNKADLLVAHHTARKVERIVDSAFAAFRAESDKYGTLSADEMLAIGVSLFLAITVKPMEKLSSNPKEMRRQLGWQLVRMMKADGDDIHDA
jgi:hypothetical protein